LNTTFDCNSLLLAETDSQVAGILEHIVDCYLAEGKLSEVVGMFNGAATEVEATTLGKKLIYFYAQKKEVKLAEKILNSDKSEKQFVLFLKYMIKGSLAGQNPAWLNKYIAITLDTPKRKIVLEQVALIFLQEGYHEFGYLFSLANNDEEKLFIAEILIKNLLVTPSSIWVIVIFSIFIKDNLFPKIHRFAAEKGYDPYGLLLSFAIKLMSGKHGYDCLNNLIDAGNIKRLIGVHQDESIRESPAIKKMMTTQLLQPQNFDTLMMFLAAMKPDEMKSFIASIQQKLFSGKNFSTPALAIDRITAISDKGVRLLITQSLIKIKNWNLDINKFLSTEAKNLAKTATTISPMISAYLPTDAYTGHIIRQKMRSVFQNGFFNFISYESAAPASQSTIKAVKNKR
jgi:hypothetical protein